MQHTLNSFVIRQFNQISAEGWPAIRRKLQRLVRLPLELSSIFFAFLLVLLIRLLRPFVIVRIGAVDVGRIGGIYQGDWYLSKKVAGQHWGRYFDFFYFNKSTSHVNLQWKKMWRRSLPSLPGTELWKNMLALNRLIPGYDKHEITGHHVYPDLRTWQAHLNDPSSGRMDIYNKRLKSVLNNRKANIAFSLEEEEMGCRALADIGIPKQKQYICFHARDSAYLDTACNKIDWSYHDYRDSSIRNYLGAAEEMTRRGCYAVRLGAKVNEKVERANPKVIDYACNGMRSDFLDIYLSAKCRFILCSDTGMSFPAEVFKRPLVYVNWTNLLRVPVYTANGLVIFKKFYLKSENRYMSFSEIMNLEFGGRNTNDIFAKLNLELQENTSEEIRAVTVEMDERLNGTWETTEEDEELQQRFWTLFGHDKLRSSNLRIGADFLRQNKDLLGGNLHLHLRCHNK